MKKREVFIFRNGNPLQYSCLESPVDRGGRWAAINGVAQSDTTEVTCHIYHGKDYKIFSKWEDKTICVFII